MLDLYAKSLNNSRLAEVSRQAMATTAVLPNFQVALHEPEVACFVILRHFVLQVTYMYMSVSALRRNL